jgi:hypothetical protein
MQRYLSAFVGAGLSVAARTGHVLGLDAWAQKHPMLRPLAA